MLRDLISHQVRLEHSLPLREVTHIRAHAKGRTHTYAWAFVCVCVVFVCVHVCQAIFERGSFSHSIFIISLHLSLFVSVVSLSPSWCGWGAARWRGRGGVCGGGVGGGHFSKTTVEGLTLLSLSALRCQQISCKAPTGLIRQ